MCVVFNLQRSYHFFPRYPSKIVDIVEKDRLVLIHFEGWNQRYDEWMPMTSEKMRPLTRHSERKDSGSYKKRRVHPHPVRESFCLPVICYTYSYFIMSSLIVYVLILLSSKCFFFGCCWNMCLFITKL